MGLQVKSLFPIVVGSLHLIDKWATVLMVKQKLVFILQPFAITVGEQVVVYPSLPHFLITKLLQPLHNCVFTTVKELSEIFWRPITALTYDLHQLIHNFKSHALLQRFTFRIAGSITCRLAKRLVRKILNGFQDGLIKLNNGFHKRRW